jgi:hypothetical protein
MKELDTVILKRDIEVEFVALDGETIVVATLESKDIRPTVRHEIAHVRQLDARPSS